MQIIEINGIEYEIYGDYPDGSYVKIIHYKGTDLEIPEIEKAKSLIQSVDLEALENTDMGKCVKALLLCQKFFLRSSLDVNLGE